MGHKWRRRRLLSTRSRYAPFSPEAPFSATSAMHFQCLTLARRSSERASERAQENDSSILSPLNPGKVSLKTTVGLKLSRSNRGAATLCVGLIVKGFNGSRVASSCNERSSLFMAAAAATTSGHYAITQLVNRVRFLLGRLMIDELAFGP